MIDCPYCCAPIPAQASLCQHCGQQVSLLLATRAELAATQKTLADATAQLQQATGQPFAATPPPTPWSPRMAVIVFYVASIVAMAANPMKPGSAADVLLPVVMATLLGWVIANREDTPNVWTIAMYAFAQPAVALIPIIVFTPRDYLLAHTGETVRDSFLYALRLGAAAGIAATLTLAVWRRKALASAFRLPRIESASGTTDKAMKWLSGMVSAVTVIGGFVAMLVNLLSPKG
ncbi:MAG: zinc ribbon domain-containing protein [Gemmatimonadaceae bacterium]